MGHAPPSRVRIRMRSPDPSESLSIEARLLAGHARRVKEVDDPSTQTDEPAKPRKGCASLDGATSLLVVRLARSEALALPLQIGIAVARKGDVVNELQVLTMEQVAERVKLSQKTVMRAIRAGDLEASQLTPSRGGWRIREEAIAEWFEARSNRAGARSLPDVRPVEHGRPRRPSRESTPARANGRLVA